MAAEAFQTARRLGSSRLRHAAVCAAVLLVALPLAWSEFAAEWMGAFGFNLAEDYVMFGYGWPLTSVDLCKKHFNFVAKPPECTYTWHVDGILVDLFVSAGILIGVGWVAQRIMSGGRPQFSLRGVLFATTCTAVCLAVDGQTLGDFFAAPADALELAKYFFVQVPLLLGAACMLATALAVLASLTTFCFRRVRATA